MKQFLHVGCGPKRKAHMQGVANTSMDAVFSSHNIEHLYPHEVPTALAEFLRVLKPTGLAIITCPDLQSVCALVANNLLTQPAYQSKAGSIAPLDILYGHRSAMARGNLYMAHRCGFTRDVLQGTLKNAGVQSVLTFARSQVFDLWAFASKELLTQDELIACVRLHGLTK